MTHKERLKQQQLSLVHLDKRRQNSNFIILKETEDVDQLLSNSLRTRVKDVGSKHENVSLKIMKKKKDMMVWDFINRNELLGRL